MVLGQYMLDKAPPMLRIETMPASDNLTSGQFLMPRAAPRRMKTFVVTTLVVLWQTND